MSSNIYIYLEIKPYIKQYFERRYGAPVRFPRGNFINFLLGQLLSRQPESAKVKTATGTALAIELPYFHGKDVRTFNYLCDSAESELAANLRHLFYTHLNEEVRRSRQELKMGYKTAIYAFMEKYGIDESAFDALKKKNWRDRKLEPLETEE